MALYSIESEQFLGMSHTGEVTVNGESAVELSDEEVDILVKLIKENNSTDVEELDLENLYPDIYSKLDEAYHDMAYNAEEIHWLREGYDNHYFEYDEDELMDYCEKNLGFSFEFKPEEYFDEDELEDYKESPDSYEDEIYEEKNRVFSEWLDDYVESLSGEEAHSFFYEHMDPEIDVNNVSYTVEIPAAIIKKAQE